jgi:heme A synthase
MLTLISWISSILFVLVMILYTEGSSIVNLNHFRLAFLFTVAIGLIEIIFYTKRKRSVYTLVTLLVIFVVLDFGLGIFH